MNNYVLENKVAVDHVNRIQNIFEKVEKLPQDKELDVDSLVQAEKSNVSTQMYEAAGGNSWYARVKVNWCQLKKGYEGGPV